MRYHKLRKNESRDQDGEPVHLTAAGIERLKKEVVNLKARIPALADEAARTAAFGDRSDNAEYKQAKGALRGAHRRIFELEQQLKRAVVIPSGPHTDGTIRLGSTVTLVDANAADEVLKEYEIVGPAETDPARGRISFKSPLGAALIGHAKNDVVEVAPATVRGSTQSYRIIEIR